MPDVHLMTGSRLTHRDDESPLLLDALNALGVSASIEVWNAPCSTSAALSVIRSTWDYTEHLLDFLSWASELEERALLRNCASLVRWNSHKSYLLDLEAAGVPIVPTALFHASQRAGPSIAELFGDGEVVIKPAVSAGARGTRRFFADSPEASAHLAAVLSSGDALVQPFQAAITEQGERSLIYLAGTYSHAVRKQVASGDFRVQEIFGGSVHPHTPSDEEKAVASAALSVADAELLYARVDLVETESGPLVMELELIEPSLYLETAPGAATRLAEAIAALL